jgi:GNAT superfamily N-acetyltransferase
VGHALLTLTRTRDDPRGLDLPRCPDVEDLLVHPDWRRRGIGTKLLLAAEATAQARGYSEIGLSVALDNLEAQRMYARRGYRDAGVGLFALGGTYLDPEGMPCAWSETCTYLVKRLREN